VKIKVDVPTTKASGGWLICNSPLGCGTRILQGWSSGIGIVDNNDFERKLTKLLHWSNMYLLPEGAWQAPQFANVDAATLWNHETLPGTLEAPIGVARAKHQFLKLNQTYTLSSLKEWIERFEKFVKDHDLGNFSKSHEWINHNYKGKPNITALWTWNGNLPKLAAVGLQDWDNNPSKVA
jgi:hypothetical protein